MDKAPDAFRTISEVAGDLDIPQHVLRFWETRFTQIKPMKRSGGRRYYRPDDVDLLRGIRHLLYSEGYTIRGVQRILKEHGIKAVQGLTEGSSAAAFGVMEDDIRSTLGMVDDDDAAGYDDEDEAETEAEIETVEEAPRAAREWPPGPAPTYRNGKSSARTARRRGWPGSASSRPSRASELLPARPRRGSTCRRGWRTRWSV